MKNTCRCCLLNDENQILFDMNNHISFEGLDMPQITYISGYEKCSGLNSEQISEIPTTDIKICQPCAIQLENALGFMDLCQKSHHILKETYFGFGYGTGYDNDAGYNQPVEDNAFDPDKYSMATFTNYSGLGGAEEAIISDDEPGQQANEESILVESTDEEDEDENGQEPSNSSQHQKYNCTECGQLFWTPKELVKHWALHTDSSDEEQNDNEDLLTRPNKHKCRECKRQFNHESGHRSLLRHIRSVHSAGKKAQNIGRKPYVRPLTTDLTADPSKEYDFNCDMCPAKYTNVGSLRSHKRKHTSTVGNFDCPTCGKEFQSQSGRTLHVQKYHMNLMHECKLCDQKFSYVMGLWRHAFDHTGTYPFNCQSCSFKTKVKPSFREHLEKEHGIKYKEHIHGCKETTKQILDTIRKPRNGSMANFC